jgi:hypothetical protein
MTSVHHCQHWPRHIITIWAIMALFVLNNSSGTFLPHHSSIGCAYLGREPFYREETCFAEDWMIGWRKNNDSTGTLPTGHIRVSHLWLRISEGYGNSRSRNNDRSKETTTSQLVTRLINTSLGAEKRNRTRPVRLKECVTWTSTACLSGSNY